MTEVDESGSGSTEATVAVRASATVDVVPNEASLLFDFSASGRSSDAALEGVQERVARIDEVCESLGIAEADRSSAVRVSEDGERDGGRWLSKGYRATANLRVVVRQADKAGPLVHQAVASAGPAIRGPHWTVTPDHPGRLEACAKAAEQAKAKATACVKALGLHLGEIVRISEPQVSARPEEGQSTHVVAATAASSVQYEHPPIDLHPGTQQVSAETDVVFRLA